MATEPRKAGRALAWVAASLVLGAAATFVVWAYLASGTIGGGGGDMSVHGWIALGLAFFFTATLGGGLMWLAFYSSRKGYDDEAGKEEE